MLYIDIVAVSLLVSLLPKAKTPKQIEKCLRRRAIR